MCKDLTDEQIDLIKKWNIAKKKLAEAKELESSFREKIVSLIFKTAKKDGSTSKDLGNGFAIKVTKKLNYTLDNKNITEVVGKLPNWLRERIFKIKYELSIKEYKNLALEHKEIIDEILIIKQATPCVEIVSPKK